jgi:hypothetical protein
VAGGKTSLVQVDDIFGRITEITKGMRTDTEEICY